MSRIPVRVLVSCAGGPGQFPHFEALKASTKYDVCLIAADFDPAVGGLFLPQVDKRYRVPGYAEAEFIPAILRLIDRERIGYWYSGLDEELPVIAAHRHDVEARGCRLLLPDADPLAAAWDKRGTFERLEGRVTQPRTWVLANDLDTAAIYAELKGRVILKAAAARGGRNIFLPADREELDFLVPRLLRRQRETGETFLVQERIVGTEYNVTSLHDLAHRPIYAISRRKFEDRPIKSTTIAAVIEERADVIRLALDAVTTLRLTPGFNNVEIIVDDDDRPFFIEVNGGRTAAQDQNVVAAGINIGDLFLDILRGETPAPIPHPPAGTVSLKIRKDVITTMADIQSTSLP